MSTHAKSVVAAFFAVILTGITAWQSIASGGQFRLIDLVPVAAAVIGAVQTHVIPNTGDNPVAKAIVGGASAVVGGLATVVASDPSGVTAAKLLTVGCSAALIWFVPEFGSTLPATVKDLPAAAKPLLDTAAAVVPALVPAPGQRAVITDALRELDALDAQATALLADAKTDVLPVQPAPHLEPTPIAAAAQAAAVAVSQS